MKKLARACTATALGMALVLGGQPVVADAAGESAQVATVELDSSRLTPLTYVDSDSVAGELSSTMYTDILVEGARVMAPSNAVVSEKGDATTVAYEDAGRQVHVERVVRTRGNTVEIEVVATNTGGDDRYLQVDMTNAINTNRKIVGAIDGERFTVGPEHGGYEVVIEYDGPVYSGVASTFKGTTDHREIGFVDPDGAQFQRGRWFSPVDAGESLTATATFTFETQESAKDSDRDGLPDQWETQGVTLDDGTRLPLHEWGADPHRPDIFLQMNWMRSEYETLGCFDDPSIEGCDEATTTSYRPSRQTFDELTERFAEHDIALHIDAGDYYSNIPNYAARHGGETENFEEYYFKSTLPALRMMANVNRLLGQRASVFHSGVVGDMMNPGNYSVGISMMDDNGFYVAKHERMTEETQLRNTIMHELGHNLGLNHNGPTKFKDQLPKSDYLPNYKSVMNYLYQFSYFDYSDVESVSGGPLPKECNRAGVDCYTGDYRVPADWDNLQINSARLGKSSGTPGAVAGDVDVAALKARDKEMAQAEANAGRIDVDIIDEGDLTAGTPGEVTLEVSNPSLDIGRFDVNVAGETRHVVLGGVESGHNTARLVVPVTPEVAGSLPLDVSVRSEAGETAFEDRLAVPVRGGVATTTALNGVQRRQEAPATTTADSRPVAVLSEQPPEARETQTPRVTPTTAKQEPAKAPQRKTGTPNDSTGSSTAAIIVPILLLLAIGGGAAFAWANDLI